MSTMPKYYENTTVFHFTWDQVAQAFWKKYPNPQSTHVLSEDTFERNVKQGKLISKRLLTKTNSSVPKWAERFVPNRPICIVEESVIDPRKKVFITYTRNVGHTKIMSVTEKVVYCESEDSPGCTVAIRSAWVESQVKGFGRAIAAFGMDRFRKNCVKMANGFNYVLTSMFPTQSTTMLHNTTHLSATSKLKDAAKNASELAKAKAAPIYASLHPNQS